MESISKIFKIGYGPSSSHTMGPKKAAETFLLRNPNASKFKISLYGSLAATGKGHLTDKILLETFPESKLTIEWKPTIFLPQHPNGMELEAYNESGNLIDDWTVFSIGGGDIIDGKDGLEKKIVYDLNNMTVILKWCKKNGMTIWEFAEFYEGKQIWDYLTEVWKVMKTSISNGLENEGVLPGTIHLPRKASLYHIRAKSFQGSLQKRALVFAYALAVAEENSAGGKIVTAPTCGSCGVVPAVLFHVQNTYSFSDTKILRALATAGLIGNLVKKNASISGAEVGCQGEIGTACAMASGATAQLFGATPVQVEYAAEMGLEHHLGLTCDPIAGMVQIPCIERNAFAAGRAMDASAFAIISDGNHRVSFDKTVKAMNQTGHDLPNIYKETSEGGLAIV